MEKIIPEGDTYVLKHEQIDWNAVAYLQKKVSKCKCDFRIEAYDKSIDKVLELPKRKATDSKLAEEIFKDSKRQVSRKNDDNSKTGKATKDFNYIQEKIVPTLEYELQEQQNLLSKIITDGLSSLTETERYALYIKATKSFHLINPILQISPRQYRNVVKKAQQKLHAYPRFKEAFFLSFLNTDLEEYNDFLKKNLESKQLILLKAI